MKIVTKTISIILLLTSNLFLNAQTDNNLFYTPESFNFAKMVIQPPNLYTGQPNINIPLYEVTSDNISIPIYMTADVGGFRPESQADRIGLNWSLYSGGNVTRIANSFVDEHNSKGFFNVDRIFSNEEIRYIPLDVFGGPGDPLWDIDHAPDLFVFNMCGYSGKFMMGWDGEFKVQSDKKFKVEEDLYADESGLNHAFEGGTYKGKILLTAEDGTQFQFGGDCYSVEYSFSGNDGQKKASTWYLTQIVKPNKDTIQFNYNNETESIHANMISSNCLDVIQNTKKAYLEEIITRSETVNFHYSLKEKYVCGSLSKKLDSIVVKNLHGVRKRNINFNYEYYTLDTDKFRLFLKSVKINNNPPFKFYYHHREQIPTFTTYAIDHWGYYNGKNDNANTIFGNYTDYDPNLQAYAEFEDRNDSTIYAKTGILKTIVYPTGASKEFTYEGHHFTKVGMLFNGRLIYNNIYALDRTVGGLRIKKIEVKENNEVKLSKSYSYFKEYPVSDPDHHLTVCSGIMRRYPNYLIGSKVSINKLSQYGEPHVTYSQVTEVNMDGSYNTYYYYNLDDFPDVSNDLENAQGDKTYVLEPENCHHCYDLAIVNTFSEMSSKVLERGMLKEKKSYNSKGDLVASQRYFYNSDPERYEDNVTGLRCLKVSELGFLPFDYVTCPGSYPDKRFWYTIEHYMFPVHLEKEESEIFDLNGNNPILTVKEYEYNSERLLKEDRSINSSGDSIKNKYSYISDYTIPSGNLDMETEGIKELQERHVLNKPIEATNWINNHVKSGQISSYRLQNDIVLPYKTYSLQNSTLLASDWPGNSEAYKPVQITLSGSEYSLDKDERYAEEFFYDQFDEYGNLLQSHKSNDISTSIIWGYDGTLPVASVNGAEIDQVYYNSFEETSSESILSEKSKAGNFMSTYRNVFSIADRNFPDGDYKMAYWFKANINDEWIFKEDLFIGYVTGNLILTSLRDGYYDEVRFCPVNAQMTTYTYEPLVGIKTQNDFNNKIIYYEYDSSGRLQFIKDSEGNYVNEYQYNYSLPLE